ncbi:MAG: nucleotidyltransferase domain-containing protein [Bacteroidales bacterium]|nr:nucleotidyltransferase domain-containing protein [Bacteroidales bacterium]
MNKNRKILNTLKLELQNKFGDKIDDVILFGSQVKNTHNIYSDYDILIILKNKTDWKEKNIIRDICYDISLDFDILIDSKIISLFELKNTFWGKHPLFSNAIDNGIHA